MGGGVHGGGILQLVAALDADPDLRAALSYDLITMGLRLEQAGTPQLSWRDLNVIVSQSPRHSAVVRHLAPDVADWGLTEQLLAGVIDAAVTISWQLGGATGTRPAPLPRPGVDGYTNPTNPAAPSAPIVDERNPWDESGTGGVFRGVATPLDELNDWLGWEFSPTEPHDEDEDVVVAVGAHT